MTPPLISWRQASESSSRRIWPAAFPDFVGSAISTAVGNGHVDHRRRKLDRASAGRVVAGKR